MKGPLTESQLTIRYMAERLAEADTQYAGQDVTEIAARCSHAALTRNDAVQREWGHSLTTPKPQGAADNEMEKIR